MEFGDDFLPSNTDYCFQEESFLELHQQISNFKPLSSSLPVHCISFKLITQHHIKRKAVSNETRPFLKSGLAFQLVKSWTFKVVNLMKTFSLLVEIDFCWICAEKLNQSLFLVLKFHKHSGCASFANYKYVLPGLQPYFLLKRGTKKKGVMTYTNIFRMFLILRKEVNMRKTEPFILFHNS